jgi:hypothetical protein
LAWVKASKKDTVGVLFVLLCGESKTELGDDRAVAVGFGVVVALDVLPH